MDRINRLKAKEVVKAEKNLFKQLRKSPLFKNDTDEQIRQFIRDNHKQIFKP